MIHRIILAGVLLFGSAALVSCQGNPEPASILTKAIAAHGGEKSITKHRIAVLSGKLNKNRSSDETTVVETIDLPMRWKRVTDVKSNGQRTITNLLMVEGKFWEWKESAEPREKQGDSAVKPYFETLHTVLNLAGDGVKLSPLDGIKVNDSPAVGFRAAWDGGTGDYYFEKAKGLLIRSDRKMSPESRRVWGDYKEIDGVQLPHKVSSYVKSRDSDDFALFDEFVVTDVRILDKLPEDAFSLPKKN
jgi:hypothetical protein